MKRVLAIVCLVISLGVLQGYCKSYESFFSSNNEYPYRTILRFAHPTNTYLSGYCYEYDNYVKVSIWSKDGNKKHNTIIKLYTGDYGIFTSLHVVECTDSWPCFLAASIGKGIAQEILRDFQSDTIEFLERLYGKRVRDMDVEEICTLYLSLMYLSY